MTRKAKKMRSLRRAAAATIVVAAFCVFGCISSKPKLGTDNVGLQTKPTTELPKRVLSKQDLDHVINAKLSRQATVRYLANIAIEDFSIQDRNTNWSYSQIGNPGGKYSVYYLTYDHRYFILLLMDIGGRYVSCVDAVTGPMPSSQYEIGMGPVEINHDHFDAWIVVIFNKNWKGNYSDDIVAAFKPNLETKTIEVVHYAYLKILREQD